MAKNYQQSGDVMPKVVAGAALASGQVVVTSSLVGISLGAYEIGEVAQVALEGVFVVPKATGAIGHGVAVYYDADGDPIGGEAGTGAATSVAAGNRQIGYAFEAAESGDATVVVLLGWTPAVAVAASAHQADLGNAATGTEIAAAVNGLRDVPHRPRPDGRVVGVMDQAFQDAFDDLAATFGAPATYNGMEIMVIVESYGQAVEQTPGVRHPDAMIYVRGLDVPQPRRNDSVVLGGVGYIVVGEPEADGQKASWKLTINKRAVQ